jgi:hypothetical protein
MQRRLRYGSQEIAVAALLQQFNQRILSSVIGSSVSLDGVSQHHLSRPPR